MSSNKKESFWGTLPGIVTAIAAVISAIAALMLSLDKTGFFNNSEAMEKASIIDKKQKLETSNIVNSFFEDTMKKMSCAKPNIYFRELKYGKGYTFGEVFNNGLHEKEVWIQQIFRDAAWEGDYNGDKEPFPSFQYTDKLKEMKFLVPPNTKVKTLTADAKYNIRNYPPRKANKYNDANLVLNYKTHYATRKVGTSAWSNTLIQTSCVAYTIVGHENLL